MEIQKLAGIYFLKTSQFVAAPIEEVWDFFSKPSNLETITPDNLNFSIRSELIKSLNRIKDCIPSKFKKSKK